MKRRHYAGKLTRAAIAVAMILLGGMVAGLILNGIGITGLFVMALDLTLAGLFQGWSWAALQPWDASVEVSQPFWIVRIFAGLEMFAGQVLFCVNLWKTWQRSPLNAPAIATTATTAATMSQARLDISSTTGPPRGTHHA